MDIEDFNNSPLELLEVLVPYKYKKKPELINKEGQLPKTIERVIEYIEKQNDNDKIVIITLVSDIINDILNICNKEPEKYKEVLKIMETAQMSYSEKLLAKGEARGRIEGEQQGILKIARNLLDILDDAKIALKTGLDIKKVQELRKESLK